MERFHTAYDWIVTNLMEFGVNVGVALLILVIGWWLSNRVNAWLNRSLARTHADATIRPVLANVLMWAVRVVALAAALERFGVRTASIIAALGAAGLAIGLALQGTLQNIAAGFMILLLRPFRVGDYIEGVGNAIAGTVVEINLFHTRLTRVDGAGMFVPNSQLWSNAVSNYTVNGTRRIETSVAVPTAEVDRTIQNLQGLVSHDDHILHDPAPQVLVSELTETGARITVTAWANTDHFAEAKAALLARVHPVLETEPA
ncbi:mechanosensitive ion channel family protein [Amantichitinum ursilacus]|uniref:Small-conductance mechanosensitive channel n=1 Tax=Amantichitinum ursilacus TaxID=857265 RepID=A0A0N0GPK6_9NEIS|nr:mechanosensitive ion channel family protein [Amantichitinum ursilacus]KPC53804.1 Small-conductance mechanosensitive channel [Amantichitinum ursilacus]